MGLWSRLISLVTPRRQPLSARRPQYDTDTDVPLGMEAIDLEMVAAAQRRNDALERTHRISLSRKASSTERAGRATYIKAMPQDETYAARFHHLFQRKKK